MKRTSKRTSALGQERTSTIKSFTSASPSTADIHLLGRKSKSTKGDINTRFRRRAVKKKDRQAAVSLESDQSIMPSKARRSALIVVERLLLFLFCCLFRFLRLLRFLSHVPLRNPKAQCKSTIDRHKPKLHQISKIDTARFKEGKRRRDTRPCEGFARCVDTARLVRSRWEEEVLTWSEDEADGSEAKQ
jgi:hypothetical protein